MQASSPFRMISRVRFPGFRSAATLGIVLCAVALLCRAPCPAQVLTPDGTLLTKKPGAPSVIVKSSLGMPFVEIPGTPVLFAAWETRVSDFATFVRESGYSWSHKPHFPQTADHPVVNVSLRDAIAFCNWLTKREQDSGTITALQSYRLPTRREWDAAAGLAGGRKDDPLAAELEQDKQKFPWGLEWPPPPRAANLNFTEISGHDDGYVYTSPVGLFTPTAEGIYDLGGNVWEWTWDREAQAEATGVLRGGSWMYFRKECLVSSYLYEVSSTLHAPSIGFRCVFEDRRRVAAFLAKAKQTEDDLKAQRSGSMSGSPAVTPDEIKKMREEMQKKSQAKITSPGLPDPATLKAAKAGIVHTNSLGMILRPLGEGSVLLVGEHEVRVQDYEAAMAAQTKSWDRKPPFTYAATHPVVNVTWQESVQFCEWLTQKERAAGLIGPRDRYRLPADLEWSRAAGLADETGDSPEKRHLANRTDFPWGKDTVPPSRSANLDTARMTGYQDSFSHTAPVGSFSPNTFHLHDLAGNVAEWCDDAWPSAQGERVIRGSSWLSSAADSMLSSARQHLSESGTRADVGFRVVLELAPP